MIDSPKLKYNILLNNLKKISSKRLQGQISINQISTLPYHLGEVEKIGSLRFDNIDMFRMVGLNS